MISETSESSGLVHCNNIILTLNHSTIDHFVANYWFAIFVSVNLLDIIFLSYPMSYIWHGLLKSTPHFKNSFCLLVDFTISMDIDPSNAQVCPIYSAGEMPLLLFKPFPSCLYVYWKVITVHCWFNLLSFYGMVNPWTQNREFYCLNA